MDFVYFLNSNYKSVTTKRDSNCASYCLYVICLTKILGIDFKYAVLSIYYRRFY